MVTIAKTDQLTETKKVLHVEIPREKVDEKVTELFGKLQTDTALPGFRKGKAPLELVKLRFDKGVREQSVQDVIEEGIRELIKEQEIRLVGVPQIDNIEKDPGENKDQPVKFTAELEYIPEYTLVENYAEMQVPQAQLEVTETDVATALENIRERQAVHEPVTDRPSQKGDLLYVDMKATIDGEPFEEETSDWVLVILGDGRCLPGAEDALTGVQADATVETDSVLPEDYPKEGFGGKTCHLVMTVRSIRQIILPELNDDFAKDSGPYQNLSELKDDLRRMLGEQAKARSQELTKQNLIAKLLELHPVAAPETLCKVRLEYLNSAQESNLKRMGMTDEMLEQNRDRIVAANQERAERDTRLSVILSDIAEREKLEVSDDEFDTRLERIARDSRYDPDAFANYVFRKGLDSYYKQEFLEDMALEFLMGKVTLTAADASAESSETPAETSPETTAE